MVLCRPRDVASTEEELQPQLQPHLAASLAVMSGQQLLQQLHLPLEEAQQLLLPLAASCSPSLSRLEVSDDLRVMS